MFVRNVATCTMYRTNFKQQVGTLRKFLMFKIKNLLQLAVPNAATPNFTAAKQAAA